MEVHIVTNMHSACRDSQGWAHTCNAHADTGAFSFNGNMSRDRGSVWIFIVFNMNVTGVIQTYTSLKHSQKCIEWCQCKHTWAHSINMYKEHLCAFISKNHHA